MSLLPIQLIPYLQYTTNAVLGTLLLGLGCWYGGQRGFHGASAEVDPDSQVTPWLVACWVVVVLRGLRRAHAVLRRWYDLSRIRTSQRSRGWEDVSRYFLSLGWKRDLCCSSLLREVLHRYTRTTKRFFFGTPSQERASR